MKRQIRRGVFETNSSSVHSLTMCSKGEYDRWKKDNLFLFTGSGRRYPDNNKPIPGNFYTKSEAIEFEKSSNYPPSNAFDWENEEEVLELLRENEWYDSGYFGDHLCSEYETFEKTFTTPGGEEIIAFGYYGHD